MIGVKIPNSRRKAFHILQGLHDGNPRRRSLRFVLPSTWKYRHIYPWTNLRQEIMRVSCKKRTKRRLKGKGLCPLIGRCPQLSLISTPSRFLLSMHFVRRPVAKLQLVPLMSWQYKAALVCHQCWPSGVFVFQLAGTFGSQTADHGRTAHVEVLEDDIDTRVRI